MKRNVKKIVLLIVLITVLALVVEGVIIFMINLAKRDSENNAAQAQTRIEANTDVRRFNSERLKDKEDISENDYSAQEDFANVLPLVRYNTFTVWPGADKMPSGKKVDPAAQLEKAKTVGLGYEKIHKKGITGQGVNIGIIDQNIHTDHPEYAHAIKEYKVLGDTQVEGSAMSTALVSLVAGKTTGVAPDVGIYYAAVAIEEHDVQYFRDAMLWYEELNKTLDEADKIRMVMIPTNLHGSEAMFETNAEMWDEMVDIAERSGITILDCADGRKFGACWRDVYKPNDFSKVKPGYPQDGSKECGSDLVLFPISQKTVAEEYDEGEYGYQYVPNSGATWALAEYVGTLALAHQAMGAQASQHDIEWFADKMYETAYVLKQGKGEAATEYRIIDVEKFCEACTNEK